MAGKGPRWRLQPALRGGATNTVMSTDGSLQQRTHQRQVTAPGGWTLLCRPLVPVISM